ncbi:hypothetical protein [Rhizobium sp. EC-SD404]|nr:hypothetical protein [Rhizobium sp. EC-SD404]
MSGYEKEPQYGGGFLSRNEKAVVVLMMVSFFGGWVWLSSW